MDKPLKKSKETSVKFFKSLLEKHRKELESIQKLQLILQKLPPPQVLMMGEMTVISNT